MRKDLDDALCRDFPNTFRNRHGNMQSTCMCWGFSCGNGWEPLIRRCAEKIEAEILKLPEDQRVECTAAQVKEKFGGLRLYMETSNDAIEAAIDEAEAESFRTCEVCGNPGVRRSGGWIKTLCDACNAEESDEEPE